jgi:hypothetical protein
MCGLPARSILGARSTPAGSCPPIADVRTRKMSSSSSTTLLIPCGAFPTATSCWPPIHLARSGRSTPMPWGCSAPHRDTGPCASYALSGPRTPACADSAEACLSPGLLSGPRSSVRADKRRARLISRPGLGQGGGQRDRSPARIGEPLPVQHPSLSERSERFGRGGPRAARAGGGHPLFPHPGRHLEPRSLGASGRWTRCRPTSSMRSGGVEARRPRAPSPPLLTRGGNVLPALGRREGRATRGSGSRPPRLSP